MTRQLTIGFQNATSDALSALSFGKGRADRMDILGRVRGGGKGDGWHHARELFAAFAASREVKAGLKGTAREDAKARRRRGVKAAGPLCVPAPLREHSALLPPTERDESHSEGWRVGTADSTEAPIREGRLDKP